MSETGFDALTRVRDQWAHHQAHPAEHVLKRTVDKGKPWGWHWGGGKIFGQVTDMAAPHVYGKVLEIGCGGGKWTKWLCDSADEVTAIDVHEVSINAARQYEPRARYAVTDGEGLPFGDDAFDVVFTYDVFKHLPLPLVMRYMMEARRVATTIIFELVDLDAPHGMANLLGYVRRKEWRHVYSYGYYNFYTLDQAQRMMEIAEWASCELLGHTGVKKSRDMVLLGTRAGG